MFDSSRESSSAPLSDTSHPEPKLATTELDTSPNSAFGAQAPDLPSTNNNVLR